MELTAEQIEAVRKGGVATVHLAEIASEVVLVPVGAYEELMDRLAEQADKRA